MSGGGAGPWVNSTRVVATARDLALLFLVGCGVPKVSPPPPALCARDGGVSCVVDADCVQPSVGKAVCGKESCCDWACASPDDCVRTEAACASSPVGCDCVGGSCQLKACASDHDCVLLRQSCAGEPLGCSCRAGQCIDRPCSAASDCPAGGGLVCKAGRCLAPDFLLSSASCEIEPSLLFLPAGGRRRLRLALFDPTGETVLPPAGDVLWWPSDRAGTVDSGWFTDPRASSTFGDVAVTAVAGQASCAVRATVYPSLPEGGARIVLIDEGSRLPVTDATIVVSDPATGALLPGGLEGGDALGQYAQPTAPPGSLLNVFDVDYGYLSIVVPPGGLPRDLIALLPQRPPITPGTDLPVEGGITVAGPRALESSGMSAAVVGLALDPDPAQLSIHELLPLSALDAFSGCPLLATAPAGGCGRLDLISARDPLVPIWDRSRFACGRRAAWALGGSVDQGYFWAVPGSAYSGSGDLRTDIIEALPAASERSGVSLETDYELERQQPAGGCYGLPEKGMGPGVVPFVPASTSDAGFAPLVAATLRLHLVLPPLPKVGAAYQESAVAVVSSIQPGQGRVPLGLSSAIDVVTDGNGNPVGTTDGGVTWDQDPPSPYGGGQPADGRTLLQFAPAHGGLEGARYAVELFSEDIEPPNPSPGARRMARAGLVRLFSALPDGTPLDLSDAGFLPYAEEAGYGWSARAFTNAPTAGVTSVRLRFDDASGRAWIVYLPPEVGSLVLPLPPAPFDDRTFSDGGPADLEVQEALLADAGYASQFDFETPGGAPLEEPIETTRAWSAIQLPPSP